MEEINLGEWEGLSWAEVKEKFPMEYEEWYKNRRYTKPPKGESYQDMLERVLAVIHTICDDEQGNIAIVTHSAVIMCIQCLITNTPFDQMAKFKADNTTIIEVDNESMKAAMNQV